MSAHFSKYDLNTYCGTPYFQSQVPQGYPTRTVLEKCRAFRRLPPNLKELAALAKRWVARTGRFVRSDIDQWYDSAGFELNPDTGRRLTDEEIADSYQYNPYLDNFTVTDIPVPTGGFADPDTWEEPKVETVDEPIHLTPAELQEHVTIHGRERTARAFNIPLDQLPEPEEEDDSEAEDYDTAKAKFAKRSAEVMDSPYFELGNRGEEKEYLTAAMANVDIYDDLAGRAQEIFDRAEQYFYQ